MRMPSVAVTFAFALAFVISPAAVNAQFRNRSDKGGGSGRSFDPTEMLKGMDANKNGMIDPSEQSPRFGMMFRRASEQAGLDMSKPLPIDKLAAAMQQAREGGDRPRGERGRDGDRRDSDNRPPAGGSSPPAASGSPTVVVASAPAANRSVGATGGGSGSLEQKYGSRVIAYVDGMLERFDKNKDNYMDSEEWKANRWSTPPEESDLNKDNRLSKEELCIRLAKRPEFAAPPQGSGAASSPAADAGGDQYRRYAESLIKVNDKDKDGKLQREEWQKLRPEHHVADANKDGTITLDELSAHLSSYASSGPSSSPSSSGGSGPRTVIGENFATGRVRRFLSPSERLPSGLPSWFLEKDADQDGQVMMSEFTTLWSDSTAAEFARSDLNNDGIITAKECLKAEANR